MPFFPAQGSSTVASPFPVYLFLPDGNTNFANYLASAALPEAATFDTTFSACAFTCEVAPTGTNAQFIVGLDGLAQGQVTFAIGSKTGAYSSFGGTPLSVTKGQLIEVAPAAANPSILRIGFTFIPNSAP